MIDDGAPAYFNKEYKITWTKKIYQHSYSFSEKPRNFVLIFNLNIYLLTNHTASEIEGSTRAEPLLKCAT